MIQRSKKRKDRKHQRALHHDRIEVLGSFQIPTYLLDYYEQKGKTQGRNRRQQIIYELELSYQKDMSEHEKTSFERIDFGGSEGRSDQTH